MKQTIVWQAFTNGGNAGSWIFALGFLGFVVIGWALFKWGERKP